MSRNAGISKRLSELRPLILDFTSQLSQGELLSGVPTVTCSVYTGTDPAPNLVANSGTLTNPTGLITVPVQGGVVGCIYEIRCTCFTIFANDLEVVALVAVIPDIT